MRNSIAPNDPTFSTAPPDPFDVLGIVRRGWPIWMLFLILGIVGGASILVSMPPSYKAEVQLVLESSANRYLQSNKVTDGPMLGDDSWTQIHIISSEAVVLPVIRKLGLLQDPEFGGRSGSQQDDSLVRKLKSGTKRIAERLGIKAANPEHALSEESEVYRAVAERLFVTWEARPAVINVSFESKDPVKAAHIANEIAAGYINRTVETKRATARLAAEALHGRLADLRDEAATAERRLLEFKNANNIFAASPKITPTDQVSSTSTPIETARLAMLDARARWEGVQRNDGLDTWKSFVPDSALISRLREQYIDIESRALEMESRVGAGHAASRKLRKRLIELSTVIAAERKRMATTYEVEYNFAKARLDELTLAMAGELKRETTNSEVTVKLRELESSAESLRSLYNSVLKRFSEDSKDLVVLPDARILASALPPTQAVSSKKRLLVLAGSASLGLLLGFSLLFGRNSPLGVFRSPEQVKISLGLMPIVLPKLRRHASHRVGDMSLANPNSRFAEAFRAVWALISAARKERETKVVGVVSALAGEGKTTIAINLAKQVGVHAGLRTLLIDADMHKQMLTRKTVPDAQIGLIQALENPERLSECVSTMEVSGVHVLPCPLVEHLPNAAQLLGSEGMEELLRKARISYDLIIIETPPLAFVTDFRMLQPHCDGVVFVVEWGKTSQRLVLETFSELAGLWERTLCVVLNKAHVGALRSIEGYKGKDFYKTYSN